MKNSSSFLIFFLLYFVPSLCMTSNDDYKIVKIQKVFSDRDNSKKVFNPLSGMDYWETKILKKGDYQEWTVEFEEST
jgi:hypothetical protein